MIDDEKAAPPVRQSSIINHPSSIPLSNPQIVDQAVVDADGIRNVRQARADAAAAADTGDLAADLLRHVGGLAVQPMPESVRPGLAELVGRRDLREPVQQAAVPFPGALAGLEVPAHVVLDVEAVARRAHLVARAAGEARLGLLLPDGMLVGLAQMLGPG